MNSVVPFSMPNVWLQMHRSELLVRNAATGSVKAFVQIAKHLEPCLGRGCGYQVDDNLMCQQGFSAPILGDEGEESMLNLIPFAGAGR